MKMKRHTQSSDTENAVAHGCCLCCGEEAAHGRWQAQLDTASVLSAQSSEFCVWQTRNHTQFVFVWLACQQTCGTRQIPSRRRYADGHAQIYHHTANVDFM